MAESYLRDREELALSIQLIDSRHQPTDLDLQLNEWLVHNKKPHIVVATKADKLSSNQLRNQIKLIEKAVSKSQVVPYSSQTGKGREALLSIIDAALKKY
jgi:GTP-binding protein